MDGALRKNTILLTIDGRKQTNRKKIGLIIMGGILIVSMTGCTYKNRGEYLGKHAQEEDELSDAMMQSIVDALETQDAEALKELFSPYALEHAENLDEKIEELIEFFPGYKDGFQGKCISKRRTNHGDVRLILLGTYKGIKDNQDYQVRFVTYPQNDEEPDKIGLYLVEMITEDAEPEGFKWKNENSQPGVYVQE